MEEIFEDEMNYFYKLQCLNKNGEGPGGKFNGPSLKTVLDKVEELDKIVQTKGFPFIEYLKVLKNFIQCAYLKILMNIMKLLLMNSSANLTSCMKILIYQ